MEILFLVCIVSVVIILVLCWPRINESIAAQQREYERQREEEEQKRQAFLLWYESLPDEQKYLVDQQLAQINSMRAMQAMIGFHIMHEWMDHGNHTDSHFPFM